MKTFQELGICDEILKAITELGYENPMPVQEQVIPHLLNEETDLVALAQTGTGKLPRSVCPLSSASIYLCVNRKRSFYRPHGNFVYK